MKIKLQPILPKAFDSTAMRKALGREHTLIVQDIKKDYEKITATWAHQVRVVNKRTRWHIGDGDANLPGTFESYTGPDPSDAENYRIFTYVEKGTRPHLIFPKKPGGRLTFIWGGYGSYKAKSTPRTIGSQAGGPTGSLVSRPYVRHPGTKKREFTVVLQGKWQANTNVRMASALVRAISASNHKWR